MLLSHNKPMLTITREHQNYDRKIMFTKDYLFFSPIQKLAKYIQSHRFEHVKMSTDKKYRIISMLVITIIKLLKNFTCCCGFRLAAFCCSTCSICSCCWLRQKEGVGVTGAGAGGGVTSGIRPGTSGVSVCNMTNKSSVNKILELV